MCVSKKDSFALQLVAEDSLNAAGTRGWFPPQFVFSYCHVFICGLICLITLSKCNLLFLKRCFEFKVLAEVQKELGFPM
jgi:hypothetical protein